MIQALYYLQDLICDVDIVGLSASMGYALVATFIWARAVWGILAVNGKFRIYLRQRRLSKFSVMPCLAGFSPSTWA